MNNELKFCIDEIKEILGDDVVKRLDAICDNFLEKATDQIDLELKTLLLRGFDCALFLKKLYSILLKGEEQ